MHIYDKIRRDCDSIQDSHFILLSTQKRMIENLIPNKMMDHVCCSNNQETVYKAYESLIAKYNDTKDYIHFKNGFNKSILKDPNSDEYKYWIPKLEDIGLDCSVPLEMEKKDYKKINIIPGFNNLLDNSIKCFDKIFFLQIFDCPILKGISDNIFSFGCGYKKLAV